MPFFTFRQNNSGGSFDYDAERGISVVVVVEAESATVAVARAKDIGLYFDGVGDCRCCGNRWSEPWGGDDDGTEVPSYYGEPINCNEFPKDGYRWMKPGKYEGFIHHADGRMEGFWLNQ